MMNQQTQVFLIACLIGAGLGAFYDVFRMIRLAVKNSAVLIFIEDALFFSVCALVTFFYMMQAVGGQLRFFIILGEFLGAVLYYFTIGALVMKISQLIFQAIRWIFHLIYRILIRPILLIFQWIGIKLQKLCSKCFVPLKKMGTNAKFRLKQQQVLLYTLFKSNKNGTKKKNGKRKEGKRSGGKKRKKK